MAMRTARERFSRLANRWSLESYNFEHFGLRELLFDARQMLGKKGIQPGEQAPDFELPAADGGSIRLRDFRGTPVLLHFGSYT